MFNLVQRYSSVLATLLVASVVLYAPQAVAHDRARALERKVQELENMLRAVQSELQQVKADSRAETERAIQAQDAGVGLTTPAYWSINSGGTVVNFYKDFSAAGFTPSGTKLIMAEFSYEW